LNDSINKELYFFDSLLNIGAISKIYYHLAVKSLRANLFDGALTHLLRKSSVYSEYTEKEVDSLKNGIFLLCNPLDTMLYRGWRTNYYLHDYYASKTLDNQKRRLTDVIKDTIIYVKDKRILVAGSFVPYLAITDRILQENLWGMGLLALTNLFKDQFKGNDLEAFEDFHPASAWSPIINAVIEDNARQVSTGRHEEIKYLDSSQRITKLDSLIGLFRGKSIFIDIWATWCYPCRQEFAFNGYIDSILNQNGIVRICISIDNPMLIETWKKTIARFNLQGYQVLAAKPLVDEIRRNLYNAGEDFLIPRYILIDRNGRVAEKDAFRPSSGKMLKAQIMAFLSNNGQTQEKSKN
jgi:thiol-disulfide isomerase/thioredoxin